MQDMKPTQSGKPLSLVTIISEQYERQSEARTITVEYPWELVKNRDMIF
jgi:type II secretory ATPase GspE/PulE/Tfp pilus assembly ATPase PilB-like protein